EKIWSSEKTRRSVTTTIASRSVFTGVATPTVRLVINTTGHLFVSSQLGSPSFYVLFVTGVMPHRRY
ncbi:unnamed protein product, partial [Brassica napus]